MKDYDRYIKHRQSMLKRAYNNEDIYSIYKADKSFLKESIDNARIDIANDREVKEIVRQSIEKEVKKIFSKIAR